MNPIDQTPGVKPHESVRASAGISRVEDSQSSQSGRYRSLATGDEFVTVTNTASELMRLERQLSELPEVDQERVAQLREAIEAGRYEVDPERIVDALLQTEQELY
ncbi:MAG: flagellar biosynthesis anti-sigma factor FlgM [Parahaliea sp.]